MRQVDDRPRAERDGRRRHQETAARAAEHVGHGDHVGLGDPRDGRKLVHARRTPHAARVGKRVGERLEHVLRDLPAARRDRLLVGLLRVDGQGVPEGADRLVVVDIDRDAAPGVAAAALPVLPRPHQRVLDERQLDRPASDRDRTRDRRPERVARHAAHQIKAGIHRFGQPGEVHAVPDEVGPHREDHVDRRALLARGFDEQADKGHGLVARMRVVAAAEPEELLELINEDQQVLVPGDSRLAHGVDQARCAAPQRGLHEHAVGIRQLGIALPRLLAGIEAENVARAERAREVADRILAGAQHRHAPRRAGARHVAALQRGNQARSDERRLAAARGPDHGEEARGAQPPEQVVDFRFTAEKQVVFVGLERAKTWKGVKQIRLP